MNYLPVEVLHQIFILLHQHDKLECMTVCRKWATVIENDSLFLTVLISDTNQLNKLIARVQQEPNLGAKVQKLVLDVDLDYDFEMDKLPFYFPNVRSFLFFNMFEQNEDYGMELTKRFSPFHPWYRHIEFLKEYSSNLHTQYILSSGICPFLNTIVIMGMGFGSNTIFINLLANAPALTTLCMIYFSITITDLELLHKVAPLLNSLTLDEVVLFRNSNSILNSLDIIPAASVKRIAFKQLINLSVEDEIALIQYISKKYINLCDLSYDGQCEEPNGTDLKRVYREGFSPLIQSLGLQLNRLSFAYIQKHEYLNQCSISKILDDGGCQVRELELGNLVGLHTNKIFEQSNQVHFIQSLTLKYISDTSNLEWLKAFTSLKELSLYQPDQMSNYKNQVIKLDELLEFVGHSLKSLQIKANNLSVNTYISNSTVKSYPSLKNLTFEGTTFTMWIDKIISKSFPQLKKLTFRFCNFNEKKIFLMPNIDLSRFEMIHKFPRQTDVHLGLTTTLNGDEERCFTVKSTYSWDRLGLKDPNIYPAIKSQQYDRTVLGAPYIKLVCSSVCHVFIVSVLL